MFTDTLLASCRTLIPYIFKFRMCEVDEKNITNAYRLIHMHALQECYGKRLLRSPGDL